MPHRAGVRAYFTGGVGTTLVAAWMAAACGGHRVPHVAPDESRPHVTWEIRTGDEPENEAFVCGSSQPTRDCVLAASTAQRRSLATVHLYLHEASDTTRYTGVMQVPFMDGPARLTDRQVNATVPAGSQPVGSTFSGRVTAKAGRYTFKILLDATQPPSATSQRIEEEVSVQVK